MVLASGAQDHGCMCLRVPFLLGLTQIKNFIYSIWILCQAKMHSTLEGYPSGCLATDPQHGHLAPGPQLCTLSHLWGRGFLGCCPTPRVGAPTLSIVFQPWRYSHTGKGRHHHSAAFKLSFTSQNQSSVFTNSTPFALSLSLSTNQSVFCLYGGNYFKNLL